MHNAQAMMPFNLVRSCRQWAPGVAVAAAALIAVAACSPGPTPSATASTRPAAIVPVPTSQLAAPSALHLDDSSSAALEKALNYMYSATGILGAECAVIFPDGSMWAQSVGVAVNSPRQAWTDDTLLSVGSISKTFTGAMVLRLVQSGRLQLDDAVSRFLPSYPNGAGITIRSLLNHTSGIRDLFEPATYSLIEADKNAVWTPAEVLAKVGQPYFAPGKGWHYSSTNYVILGEIVEAVTGEKLAVSIRRDFLQPLGLTHTFLQSEETPVGPLAHGYMGTLKAHSDVSVGQPLLPYVSAATATGASGAMASTATDIAKWADALYRGRVFDPAWLATLLDTTDTAQFDPHFPYGLTVEQFNLGDHFAWGHRGHVDGFWSIVAYVPDLGVTVALLTNADWINTLLQLANLVKAVGP
jgi:D-alanyl-D-alanine carboxypeptidase